MEVNWNELVGRNVANRGVDGDGAQQMLNRMRNILREEPKFVFVMGGINDI